MGVYLTTTVLTIPLLVHLVLLLLASTLSLYSLDTEAFSGPAEKTAPLLQTVIYQIYCLFRALVNIIGLVMLDNYLSKSAKEQEDSLGFLFVLGTLHLVLYLLYSIGIRRFSAEDESSAQGVYNSVMNAVFMMLGQSVTVCSGGACNSIYISTLTSICSALGIPVVEWLPYVQKSVFLLLFFNVYTLWSVKRSFAYPPCVITCVSTALLAYDILVAHSTLIMVVANLAIIAAAIMNMKYNPADFKFSNPKLKLPI